MEKNMKHQYEPKELASACKDGFDTDAVCIPSQAGRSLSKSQSQNKLLFAPKFKEQTPGQGQSSGSGQELLFKHHQFSSANGQNHKTYQLKHSNKIQNIMSYCSTKECTFCNKQDFGMINSHSLGINPCSAIFCAQNYPGMLIQGGLSKKYSTNRDYYNVKTVNDLIYNENTHIVSIFKDYLILDDINEFLKRSYTYTETKVRLPKLCSFYDKYSQVFPNYVVLPESKYMFKNIQKKQKLIDEVYQIQEENAKRQHQTLCDDDRLFNSRFYNSVYKLVDISMTRQQYEDQAKQISTINSNHPNHPKNKAVSGSSQNKNHPQHNHKTTQAINGQGRFEEMKIEDLMERFLMKDSQSNIHMITTVTGLDFSGFTHSTIAIEKTPNKQSPTKNQQVNREGSLTKPHSNQQKSTSHKQPVPYTQHQQMSQKQAQPYGQQAAARKNQPDALLTHNQRKPQQVQQVAMGVMASGNTQLANAVRKQKGSFNQNQVKQATQPIGNGPNQKLEISKGSAGGAGSGGSQYTLGSSAKTTPRLKKSVPYTQQNMNQDIGGGGHMMLQVPSTQNINQSPATKEAISNYLQHCQIDLTTENDLSGTHRLHNPNVQILESTTSNHLTTIGSGGGQAHGGQTFESPSIKSPNGSTQKFLMTTTSQTALSVKQKNQITSSMSTANNRQMMKSQCTLPTSQTQNQHQITNLKKTNHRLSSGGGNINQIQPQSTSNASHKQQMAKKGVVSPSPQNIVGKNGQGQKQSQQTVSRNMGASNSTQKSAKSTNSHAKYLSGGNDKLLKILRQESKSTLNNVGNVKSGTSADFGEHEVMTGEDCDDCGIADERFASPDAYATEDFVGRPSIGGEQVQGFQQQQQPALVTISDNDPNFNKMLSQYTNYDEIKKHLEKYITTTSGGGQQQQVHTNETMGTQFSDQKNGNRTLEKIHELNSMKGTVGYNRNQLAQSAGYTTTSQNGANGGENGGSNSRNGTAQKQFESLKQKIRGVFEQSSQTNLHGGVSPDSAHHLHQQQHQTNQSNKTPSKNQAGAPSQSSSVGRGVHNNLAKSTTSMGSGSNLNANMRGISNTLGMGKSMVTTANAHLHQNVNKRMSIESQHEQHHNNNLNHPHHNIQGCLSSTNAAGGRTLSFSQNAFNSESNYQSTLNLQQRKGSNMIPNKQPETSTSIENQVRLSQSRQSFKDLSQSDQQKVIKRCATAGKTLTQNDFQNHTFGRNGAQNQTTILTQQQQQQQLQLKQSGSQTNLGNPTFISATNKQQTINQLNALNPSVQAANTVRVMTPSYSLASLSKLVSPTQQTTGSPITMTVTVSGAHNNTSHQYSTNQSLGGGNRKQALGGKKGNQYQNPSFHQHQQQNQHKQSAQTNMMTCQVQTNNFMVNDKGGKMVPNVKTVTLNTQPINNKQNMNVKVSSVKGSQQQLNPSQSMNTFQMTPRNQQSQFMGQYIGPSEGGARPLSMNAQQMSQFQQDNSHSFSCTISTDNNNNNINSNSTKALESKHPKFMRTIEEGGVGGGNSISIPASQSTSGYNTMLSSTLGKQKSTALLGSAGLANSVSQAQYDTRAKVNIQSTVLASTNSAAIQKKQGMSLATSQSTTHFKSPSSQQVNIKKGSMHGGVQERSTTSGGRY